MIDTLSPCGNNQKPSSTPSQIRGSRPYIYQDVFVLPLELMNRIFEVCFQVWHEDGILCSEEN